MIPSKLLDELDLMLLLVCAARPAQERVRLLIGIRWWLLREKTLIRQLHSPEKKLNSNSLSKECESLQASALVTNEYLTLGWAHSTIRSRADRLRVLLLNNKNIWHTANDDDGRLFLRTTIIIMFKQARNRVETLKRQLQQAELSWARIFRWAPGFRSDEGGSERFSCMSHDQRWIKINSLIVCQFWPILCSCWQYDTAVHYRHKSSKLNSVR